MITQNKFAKLLNLLITEGNFIDKDTNEYIYASISQPPIKIVNKNDSDDELDFTVECPNCHAYVNYGNQIFMRSGYIYCDNKECLEKLINSNKYLGGKE